MNQEKIWAYFQNEGVASFEAALPRYQFLQRKIRKLVSPPVKLLNIGVGSGKLEAGLTDAGYTVSALDPDANAIDRVASTGVDAHVGIAQELPFRDGSFDVVIASEVLEHLEVEDCRIAISQISRVLRRGGHLIGTVPYQEKLVDNLTICPHCGHRFHRWGHRQTFGKAELSRLLMDDFDEVSLSIRSFVEWNLKPSRIMKSVVKYMLGRMGEQIATPHIYFVCRRGE